MATYNGARFLEVQLASILRELQPTDELVVVDDGSSDGTIALIESFMDLRITILRNSRNLGPPASFARAISVATGDVIMLADQDDEWVPGRVEALIEALRVPGVLLVSSNSEYVDADGRPVEFPMPPLRARDSDRRLRNIARIFAGRIGYYGCAMAFRRPLKALVLPIPRYVEAHDLWIAMAANLRGVNAHLETITLRRRIHGENASIMRRPLARKLLARVRFARGLLVLSIRTVISVIFGRP